MCKITVFLPNKEIIINFASITIKNKSLMLTSLSEMRARARQSLQGHWGSVALITLINAVISVTISGISNATTFLSIFSIFTAVFSATYAVSLYRTHRKSDDYDDLFNVYFDLGDKKWLRYLGYQMAYVIPLAIILIIIIVLYLVAGSFADLIDLGTLTGSAKTLSPWKPNSLLLHGLL